VSIFPVRAQDAAGSPSYRLKVESDIDVLAVRFAVKRCAEGLEFGPREITELVIVVSELGSNILKYGLRGEMALDRVVGAAGTVGIRIVARDRGPPFHDLNLALKDGHGDRGPVLPEHLSGRRGIGSGLGAVVRFTDSFACIQDADEKRIVVIRYPRGSRGARPERAHEPR
jgi:anti-sigma regulatory factor (Ser/Thr protein kinase)